MIGEQSQLFIANQHVARAAMGDRFEKLNWDVIRSRKDCCDRSEKRWKPSSENFLLFPQMMPTRQQTADHYVDLIKDLRLGEGIEQYLDVHGKDIHLLQPIVELRNLVRNLGFDENYSRTTDLNLRPYFLIAFGTGNGKELQALIERYRPYHVVIALADWQDMATSFWSIDWQKLAREQQLAGKLTIGCYEDGRTILNLLIAECLPGIDHTLIYLPPESACDPRAKLLREQIDSVELSHTLNYLGYTTDEHNMVWNSWHSLAKNPRVYRKPHRPLTGGMVVCGSGPSLDMNIENLRELSQSHLITACGSNFRTLKSHGIRVDLLALVERADVVYSDIKNVVEEYGAGDTRLVMSTTCHYQLQELFCDSMVYFRPALTPLALFSNSPSEVLSFEGPESINTGVALAASLGMSELILVGVDLGTRSLEKVRSQHAAGKSPRDFNIEVTGNFGGTVYTSTFLRDARMGVEACLRTFSELVVLNASDGVAIEGAIPTQLSDYLKENQGPLAPIDFLSTNLGLWWTGSTRYTPERFLSSWKSRRPRAEVAVLTNQLRELFASDTQWNPTLMKRVTELLALDVPPAIQFPRRVLRSTFHKLVVAINRQIIVMAPEPQKAVSFERQARLIIVELLDPLERELYALCDALEALPEFRQCVDTNAEVFKS